MSRETATRVSSYRPRIKPWLPGGLMSVYNGFVQQAAAVGGPSPAATRDAAGGEGAVGYTTSLFCRQPSWITGLAGFDERGTASPWGGALAVPPCIFCSCPPALVRSQPSVSHPRVLPPPCSSNPLVPPLTSNVVFPLKSNAALPLQAQTPLQTSPSAPTATPPPCTSGGAPRAAAPATAGKACAREGGSRLHVAAGALQAARRGALCTTQLRGTHGM